MTQKQINEYKIKARNAMMAGDAGAAHYYRSKIRAYQK